MDDDEWGLTEDPVEQERRRAMFPIWLVEQVDALGRGITCCSAVITTSSHPDRPPTIFGHHAPDCPLHPGARIT
jgi:hypothetical protein